MPLTLSDKRPWTGSLLIVVLLLALALRLYRIEAQSLWNDEGTSVALAARSLATITESAANDIHPPLYYYFLHFWIKLFGNSELAVRSLSALFGMLLVLMTYLLGRATTTGLLPGKATASIGLLGAFVSSLSPLQIYYSQETRMYMLSALLGALSMYTFLHLLTSWQDKVAGTDQYASTVRRSLPFAAYTLTTILLLYTHYFNASIVVAQNLAFVYWLLTDSRLPASGGRWPAVVRWAAAQAAVAAAYLPWVLLAAGQLRAWPAISEPMPLTSLLVDVLRTFSLGLAIEPRPGPIVLGFATLLLLGIAAPLLRSRDGDRPASKQTWMGVTLALYLFGPVAVIYVLSLQRPMYDPKFLLLGTPPFYLFLAQGILSVARWQTPRRHSWLRITLALAAVAFVAACSLRAAQAYYFDPRYARDDYRGIAQYIQAVQGQSDAILINAPGQIETFTYYYRGQLPLYPLPRQRPLDETQTEAELQQLLDGRQRVFAVLWATDESDPRRFVEGWLDQHTYKATDSWYGNVRLAVYAVPIQPQTDVIQSPMQVNLGDQIRLLGYNLLTTEVPPGDILQLTLFWEATAPINERYKVFTHVVGANGHLVGQHDAEPGGGALITTIWEVGGRIADNYGLPILPATPPGEYRIVIGMYALDDGQRLPVIEGDQAIGDHIILQSVHVLPAAAAPPLSLLGMDKQLSIPLGDVTLLGYKLAKLGYEHQPDAPIRAGDILHLTLFWQANPEPHEDIAVLLQLQDEGGIILQERRVQPTEGLYPSSQWHPGEMVRDQHNWHLSPDLRPGRYPIYLSVQKAPDDRQIGPRILLTHLALSD